LPFLKLLFVFFTLAIAGSVCLYIIGIGLEYGAAHICQGWDCETVSCPKGYAVLTPDGYLPCDKFDDYVNGNKTVILKEVK
jgi:hypothetical protein